MVVVGSFLVLQSLMVVDPSHSVPFSPVPQACIGTWPLLCWQDWRGGQQGNFKLSGQNVKFTHEFTQQEGERPEQAHPMPGSYPSACLHFSSPTLLSALGQNRHKPQGPVAGLS